MDDNYLSSWCTSSKIPLDQNLAPELKKNLRFPNIARLHNFCVPIDKTRFQLNWTIDAAHTKTNWIQVATQILIALRCLLIPIFSSIPTCMSSTRAWLTKRSEQKQMKVKIVIGIGRVVQFNKRHSVKKAILITGSGASCWFWSEEKIRTANTSHIDD